MIQHDLSKLIISSWNEGQINLDGYYLVQTDGKYEVFLGERGGKMWLKIYDNLHDATVRWLDLIFDEIGYSVPD